MWCRPLEWNLNGTTDPRDGSVDHLLLNSLKDRHGPIRAPKSRLGPVEDARQAIPGTAPPKRPRTADERSHLQPQGSLADQLLRSPAQGLHQSSLPSSGFANHEARECLIRRTAVYGPVRTAVWEGRSREAPPYPDWARPSTGLPPNFTVASPRSGEGG